MLPRSALFALLPGWMEGRGGGERRKMSPNECGPGAPGHGVGGAGGSRTGNRLWTLRLCGADVIPAGHFSRRDVSPAPFRIAQCSESITYPAFLRPVLALDVLAVLLALLAVCPPD